MPRWFDHLAHDLRYGARVLRLNPAFSAVVILTLALGTGANTAIFSVVQGVLLQPLPYDAADRQVRLQVVVQTRSGSPDLRPLTLPVVDTRELAERTQVFERLGNVAPSFTNLPGREPRWSGAEVTASVFAMVGMRPLLGRAFEADDEREGAPDVMVISYQAWQRHFGGDPGVLGSSIRLEPALLVPGAAPSHTYTIVGVAPAGFDYLPDSAAQYWIPLRQRDRGHVVGRLKRDVSPSAALREIHTVVQDLYGRAPRAPRALGFEVVELQRELVAPVRPALLLLMGAVVAVLLIACVNVANLFLVRSAARQRETAIRVALGAGRRRILQQAMIESLVLTALGTASGTAMAAGALRVLRWLASTTNRVDLGQGSSLIPRLNAVSLDWTALVFTIGVAAAVALVFGLIPAAQTRRVEPTMAFRAGGSASSAASSHRSAPRAIRGVLVVAEVALSIVLLVGGGLLLTSFAKLLRVDVGYDAADVLTFQVSLPSERYPLPRQQTFAEDFVARLRALPGVSAAAYSNQLPLVRLRDSLTIGRTPDAHRQPGAQAADVRLVSRTYFTTMGITLISGRLLDERDQSGQARVLLVNAALARRDFGDVANAVGQQVYVGGGEGPWSVVGVVNDVRQFGVDTVATPQIFIDARQWGKGLSPLFPLSPYYTLRFTGEEAVAIAAVRSVLERIEEEGVLFNVAPMAQVVSGSLARPRLYAALVGAFAAVGLIMALIGIYGVLSYSVSQRTRELGIRAALGARPGAVVALVLRQTMLLTCVGIVAGLLGAAALSRALETMLFDLKPLEPAIFAGVGLLFVVFTGLAAYAPARRATRVDPLVALRSD